jgi:hypothetical protein
MPEPSHRSLPASGPPREEVPPSFWRDGRAAFALVFRSPIVLFIFCNLTFVTVLTVLQETGLQGLSYIHTDRTRFWHMLVALGPTAWLTCLLLLLGDFERNPSAWPSTRRGRLALLLCLVPLLLLLTLPLLAQLLTYREDPLVVRLILPLDPNFLPKMVIVSLLGLPIYALHTSALVGIHLQLLARLPKYQHLGEAPGAESLEEEVLWYQRRQAQLKRFLSLTSALLGVSMLSVGALRNLINASVAPSASAEMLPTTSVMSYGFYYSGLIASLYVPAHKTLKDVGQALAERLVWQSLGAHPTWKQRQEEQQAVRDHLGLQDSALQELQQGLAVFAPLLASISSLVLDTSR